MSGGNVVVGTYIGFGMCDVVFQMVTLARGARNIIEKHPELR